MIPRHTTPRRVSPKREAALRAAHGGRLPASTIRPSRKPIARRNADRKAATFARVYGSESRVQWVQSLPCLACLLVDRTKGWGTVENAHVTDPQQDKGTGRKAHFSGIVPLCRGHHVRFDRWLFPFNDPAQREFIERQAERIEAAWQAHLARERGE